MPRPQPLQPCVLHEHWLSLAVPAALAMDSARVMVLDIRYPTMPVAELQRHQVRPEQRWRGRRARPWWAGCVELEITRPTLLLLDRPAPVGLQTQSTRPRPHLSPGTLPLRRR